MKNRAPLYTLILMIGTASVFVGISVYMYLHIEKTKGEIKIAREEIKEARKQEEDIQTLRRTLRTTVEDQIKLDDHFISKGESVSFIEAIEQTGKDGGTELEIKSVTDTGEVGLKKLKVEVLISGSYDKVKNTILRIEHMPYELFVESVFLNSVIGQTTGVSTGMFDATVTLTLLSYNE